MAGDPEGTVATAVQVFALDEAVADSGTWSSFPSSRGRRWLRCVVRTFERSG